MSELVLVEVWNVLYFSSGLLVERRVWIYGVVFRWTGLGELGIYMSSSSSPFISFSLESDSESLNGKAA